MNSSCKTASLRLGSNWHCSGPQNPSVFRAIDVRRAVLLMLFTQVAVPLQAWNDRPDFRRVLIRRRTDFEQADWIGLFFRALPRGDQHLVARICGVLRPSLRPIQLGQ